MDTRGDRGRNNQIVRTRETDPSARYPIRPQIVKRDKTTFADGGKLRRLSARERLLPDLHRQRGDRQA